jgi:hypothetical protein
MTRTGLTIRRCAVCGEECGQSYVMSSNGTGNFDLDFRLHGMIRDMLNSEVSRCPSCGYCAPDIGRKMKKTEEIVRSEEYQRQLVDIRFSSKTNEFLCASMLYEFSGSYPLSIYYALCAAWKCDDEEAVEQAKQIREKAIDMFPKALKYQQPLYCPPGGEKILYIDLLRRTGRFEEARNQCEKVINGEMIGYIKRKSYRPIDETTIRQLLLFEQELIRDEDSDRHSYFAVNRGKTWDYSQEILTVVIN